MDEVLGRSSSARATRTIFGGRKPEKDRAGNVLAQENLSLEMKLLAQSDMDKLRERKAAVDNKRAGAESELLRARSMAMELARQIEQTRARAASKRSEFSAMLANKKGADESRSQQERDAAEVVKELDRAKQELRRLKGEVKSAAEAKAKAEGDIVASAIKIQSDLRAADEMKRLVDEANEEYVLVELARIEAERELLEIDAQRRLEIEGFARDMEETKAKIEALRKDVSRARDLEAKLAMTNSDVEVLQAEMELVRAMERKNAGKTEAAARREKEEAQDRALLQAAEAELDAAKKELESIKAEGFRFMSSMDSTRTEVMRVAEEVNRLKVQEEKADAQVQQLNAKLLKARARMDAVTAAGKRSTAIVSNLTTALQQLRAETDAARKAKEVDEVEQRCVRVETENVNAELAVTEARIYQSVKELEAAKASEAAAMKKLKGAVESTMQARASQGWSGTITISRFEYEYLTGRAALVRAVADKKVSAAQAWVQALKAGEKELAARAEAAERKAREVSATEARTAAAAAERAAAEQKALEQELYDLNAAAERDGLLCAYPRRRSTRVSAAMRRARRSSVSSLTGARDARPPSFAVKRKRKVMPNLLKLIRERRGNGSH